MAQSLNVSQIALAWQKDREHVFLTRAGYAGGRLRLRLNVKDLGDPERLADLDLMIWGDNLHAPLIERIVELPMDIYGGRCPSRLHITTGAYAVLPALCHYQKTSEGHISICTTVTDMNIGLIWALGVTKLSRDWLQGG